MTLRQRTIVRRVVASEWRALRNLRLRALEIDPLAFGSTLSKELNLSDRRWRDRAATEAESPTSAQWVAEVPSGRLVGSMTVTGVEDTVYVFGMWVERSHRGQGVGSRLLDKGLAWASTAFPGRETRLDVNPRQTAAVLLYESRGFRRSGADRPLGHTPGEIRYEMTRRAPTATHRGLGSQTKRGGR